MRAPDDKRTILSRRTKNDSIHQWLQSASSRCGIAVASYGNDPDSRPRVFFARHRCRAGNTGTRTRISRATKILAIGRLTSKSTPGAVSAVLPEEVRDTVKLYLAGKIDQWYVRKDQAAVVFVLNIADVKEAREALAQLPLGRANLMEFDLIPLGPLSPLAMLGTAPAR
jgi:hypothetical protein